MSWIARERRIRKINRLSRRGRREEALEEARAAMTQFPQNADVIVQTAWVLMDSGKTEEALSVVTKGLESHPRNPVLLMLKGEIQYAQASYSLALQTFQQALAEAGDNLRIEYDLGLTYVALGDMDRASEYFESSIRYDRNLVQSRLLAMAESFLLERRKKTPPSVSE